MPPLNLDIPHGGWIPKGRQTEDGSLPEKYQLTEMSTGSYSKRTEQNVIDSDGTLILSHGKLTGGSLLTLKLAKRHGRPWLHINLGKTRVVKAVSAIKDWIINYGIKVLNVAGPRASKDPKIYQATRDIIESL
ncbi:MAG: putative molybdenum carrier protein [Desulfobacterales bacterium]|nr:putative molybdenum carrier protein [Desulfobacterales bacterium]